MCAVCALYPGRAFKVHALRFCYALPKPLRRSLVYKRRAVQRKHYKPRILRRERAVVCVIPARGAFYFPSHAVQRGNVGIYAAPVCRNAMLRKYCAKLICAQRMLFIRIFIQRLNKRNKSFPCGHALRPKPDKAEAQQRLRRYICYHHGEIRPLNIAHEHAARKYCVRSQEQH